MRDRSSLSNCRPPSCGESSVSTAWTAPRCSPAQRFAYPVEAGFEEHFLQLGGYQAGHEASKVIVDHGGQASLGAERKKNSFRRAFTPKTSLPHSASGQHWQKRSRYEGGVEQHRRRWGLKNSASKCSPAALSRGRAGRRLVEVSQAGGFPPRPLFPHLKLCHLLLQVDDELLDPGIVSFVLAELLLPAGYKKGCLFRGPAVNTGLLLQLLSSQLPLSRLGW